MRFFQKFQFGTIGSCLSQIGPKTLCSCILVKWFFWNFGWWQSTVSTKIWQIWIPTKKKKMIWAKWNILISIWPQNSVTFYLIICCKDFFKFWHDDKKPEIEIQDIQEIFQKVFKIFQIFQWGQTVHFWPKMGQITILYLKISSKDFFESFHDGEAPKYSNMNFNEKFLLRPRGRFFIIWAQISATFYLEIYSKDFLNFSMIIMHLK